MKKILFLFVLGLLSLSISAQEEIIDQLKLAYEAKAYEQIISEHSEAAKDYPAKAVYYIGLAYYMKSDDKNALKMMDLSIKKEDTDPDAFFIKGMTLSYMKRFKKAVKSFHKAIAIDSSNTNYFCGLGDAYKSQEMYEEALAAYLTASEKKDPNDRAFAMIPQIYGELNQKEKALEAFYKSKEMVSKTSSSYILALYNIGLFEYLKKNYEQSAVAFEELIELDPEDYISYPKLIQVYYGQQAYDKAKPLIAKLYQASEEGLLKDNLSKMFCLDQFDWEDKLVLAYERFGGEEDKLYYKHVFYVTNEKGETEWTIQSENSPISLELGGPKYLLGMDKDGGHTTFQYGFKEGYKYEDLKKAVIAVLDEEIQEGVKSKRTKKNK